MLQVFRINLLIERKSLPSITPYLSKTVIWEAGPHLRSERCVLSYTDTGEIKGSCSFAFKIARAPDAKDVMQRSALLISEMMTKNGCSIIHTSV